MEPVTIVTGGGRGIGLTIALRMARNMRVAVVGRTESDLAKLCELVAQIGGFADYYVGDVSDIDTARRVSEQLKAKNQVVENLICNAGIGSGGPLHTFSVEKWKRMFEVNVHGTFFFARTFLPEMMDRKKGSICIISSIAGLKGYKNQTAYCATKHALVGMAQSLALECAKHNIQVVPICPSFVESEMTDRTATGLIKHRGISKKQALEIIASTNPQNRIMSASEIAEMVAIICEGRVPSLNGNPIRMSGGE